MTRPVATGHESALGCPYSLQTGQMRPSTNRYSWPLLAIVAGVLLIGLYALVREPAAIGLGLVLLAGYGLTGGGLIALVITFVERER